MLGAEHGGRGEDDQVNARVDDLLVGIEADEHAFVGDILSALGKLLADAIETVDEHIAQGGNLDAVGSIEQVADGTRATSAAADETGFQFAACDGLVGEFGNVVLALGTQGSHLGLLRGTGGQERRSDGAGQSKLSRRGEEFSSVDIFHCFMGLLWCLMFFITRTTRTARTTRISRVKIWFGY